MVIVGGKGRSCVNITVSFSVWRRHSVVISQSLKLESSHTMHYQVILKPTIECDLSVVCLRIIDAH